ncbi:MAG: hypothetical protein LUD68_09865 [Rikenellaceae bacterium]|nr:hypothetical protein [Rikenellaceae bacterium]
MMVGILLIAPLSGARAQNTVSDKIIPDTAVLRNQYEESNRFYRRLEEKAENSRLAKRLYRAMVSPDDRIFDTPEAGETGLEKEITYFKVFDGQRINSIEIIRRNIFLGEYPKNDFRSLANFFHTVIQESYIRRNLLFKEGDRVQPSLMALNEQLLRSQDYLSDAAIVVQESRDGESVHVQVITQDSWSLGVTVRSVSDSRRYLDLYDDNIFGHGNRMDLRTYFRYTGKKLYGGQMLEYTAINLFGAFYELNALVGWGFDERRFGGTLKKPFILPVDYMAGATASDNKYFEPRMDADTSIIVRRRTLDGWAGKSWNLPALRSSYYLIGRYRDVDFRNHPEIRSDSNTMYHSYRELLVSTGIYRESYYRGNMIYAFGRTENIPYGHRFEFTAGRHWGEFQNKWYTAFSSAVGRQIRLGYVRGEATVGTFWDEDWRAQQSFLALKFDGFTDLWRVNNYYVRHFFRWRYTQGWNRLKGEGEFLSLWNDSILQGIRRGGIFGKVRMLFNTETVVFTPLYFYGFRFVFFGFGDFGWIGDHRQPLKNEFYTSFGLGVRLKNERLNFTTIQLRLGFGFSEHGPVGNYRTLRYSSESKFLMPSLKPEPAEVYPFR